MKTIDEGKGIYGRLPKGHEILLEIASGAVVEYDGRRWQNDMAAFILEHKYKTVVETGVSNAVSTDRILRAMEQYSGAILYSADPHPMHGTFKNYADHPNWRHEQMFSLYAMPLFFMEAGPYDLFVHDSDHGVETQTFEYEAGWGLTKPGGYICSDDWTWDNHRAWDKFCERHGVGFSNRGACVYAQKPLDALMPEHTEEYAESVMAAAYELSQLAVDRPAYFR